MVCDTITKVMIPEGEGLNPYSIGIWSATIERRALLLGPLKSLNPYSIGIWSATMTTPPVMTLTIVLILILLEYGLRQELKFNL